MTNQKIEALKSEAYKLWRSKQLDKAVEIILKLEKIKSVREDFDFNLIFSACLSDDKKYSLAVRFLSRATGLNPSNELASNYLFVNLVTCKAYNLAMNELVRFLSDYPAKKNYKVTLHELLADLNKGNAKKWEDQILHFSKKNRIPIKRYYPNSNK